MIDADTNARVRDAEKRIQRILLELQEEAGSRVDHVNVDTRNFANCGVEIFFEDPGQPRAPKRPPPRLAISNG